MCIRLASMLHGALGVTGTGMPFFCRVRCVLGEGLLEIEKDTK